MTVATELLTPPQVSIGAEAESWLPERDGGEPRLADCLVPSWVSAWRGAGA